MRSTVGPKQFMEVNGKPILIYTLERFAQHNDIDGIYIVVRKSKEELTRTLVEKFSVDKVVRIVTDDDNSQLTAHSSIANGIMSMKDDGIKDDDLVLVHDGVRPIIDDDTIARGITAASKHGNAITCMPATETVAYRGANDTVGDVTIRDNIIILQAPQIFNFRDAYDTNAKAIDDNIVGTVVDQAELNRHYGNTLHTIEGLKGNVKITVPLDFAYFEFLVTSGKYDAVMNGEAV